VDHLGVGGLRQREQSLSRGAVDVVLRSWQEALERAAPVWWQHGHIGDRDRRFLECRVDRLDLELVEDEVTGELGGLLDPVDDRDFDDGLTRPRLRRDRVGDDTAVLDDVVQAGRPCAVLRDRVRPDEAGSLAGLQVVVRLPEPVDAVVLDPAVELALEPGDVVVAQQAAQVAITVERRIADDDARPRPGDAQRVAGADAGQVSERQRRLVEIQLVDRELVAHPQRHPGERDREGVDLDPLDVRQREEGRKRALLRPAAALGALQLALPLVQAALEAAQLSR